MLLMMYPGVVNMVPTFKLVCSTGLYNSHWALIITGIASAQAFTIYVLRNFIEEIPQDLFEAIEIDGGTTFHQIWHVVLPMSMPIIGTLAILRIIGVWNDFVGPLLYLRDSKLQVIAVALLHLEGEYTADYNVFVLYAPFRSWFIFRSDKGIKCAQQ
jgi:ABC-type glycerol-3-phosphate transport system permease component